MRNRTLMLRQLDRIFKETKAISSKLNKPNIGWIRVIRKALGMTSKQLAKRLGVERRRVTQIENAEQKDAITLRTLRAVAKAMDCELIYGIVPRSTLEELLNSRAKKIVVERMKTVAHTMSLEDQAVPKELEQEQMEELVKELLESSPKKLWEEN